MRTVDKGAEGGEGQTLSGNRGCSQVSEAGKEELRKIRLGRVKMEALELLGQVTRERKKIKTSLS